MKLLGKKARLSKSVRVDEDVLKRIVTIYGSLSAFVNEKIKNDKKLKRKGM